MSAIPSIAIVDYGMGNLFSVHQAFAAVGQPADITASPARLASADAIVIPGVGAFGIAMDVLERTGMAEIIKDRVSRGTPLVGICLGLQLMMSSSTEFGHHAGLGLIPGDTAALRDSPELAATARIPHVGWSGVDATRARRWEGTPLANLVPGHEMYFVHSYYVRPHDQSVTLSTSEYLGKMFCSSVAKDHLFGCQFHPERSGPEGLAIYRRIVAAIRSGEPFGGTH
jgi:imidazole glycerol-phosphate synthase subunit HisH